MEEENAAQQQKEQLLKAQLKGLQDDLRRVGRRLEMSSKDKAQLTGMIDELNLHIDSTQRELKKVVARKQVRWSVSCVCAACPGIYVHMYVQ